MLITEVLSQMKIMEMNIGLVIVCIMMKIKMKTNLNDCMTHHNFLLVWTCLMVVEWLLVDACRTAIYFEIQK